MVPMYVFCTRLKVNSAEEIKQKVAQISLKSDKFRDDILLLADLADQIKGLIIDIGMKDAPLVLSHLQVAVDDLGAANYIMGQVVDTIEVWAHNI